MGKKKKKRKKEGGEDEDLDRWIARGLKRDHAARVITRTISGGTGTTL